MQRKSSVWVGAGLFLLVGVLSGCSFAGPITAEKEVPPEAKSPLFEEESPPEETFPIENAGACAGTPFSLYDVQPGDQVGPWTVVSIGQPEGGGPDWDEDHVEVTFQGPVTLEGFYWYDPGDDLDGFPGFSVAREAQHLMPRALEIPPCVTGFWTQDEGFFRPYTGGWARV
ncbi:MAG: hypothetical protein QJR00_07910, partial [Bacillota bacterium]|nr:hypothetical protein [Bacillota bacterium]